MHYIYPTPLYQSSVEDFSGIQGEISDSLDNIEWKDKWSTHSLSDTTFSNDNLGDKLKKELLFHVRRYTECELPWKCTASWISLFKKGDYAHPHNHGPVDVCGVYYYKSNEVDGSIYFKPANPALAGTLWYNGGSQWSSPPKEGELFLFPGWLDHGVTPNETDEDRISISFNIMFDRISL